MNIVVTGYSKINCEDKRDKWEGQEVRTREINGEDER